MKTDKTPLSSKFWMQETLGMPVNARDTILRNATSQWWLSLWTSSKAMVSFTQGGANHLWHIVDGSEIPNNHRLDV